MAHYTIQYPQWIRQARIWQYVDASGTVLATLEPDADSGQYRDSRGVLCGRKWEDARSKAEAAAKKGQR